LKAMILEKSTSLGENPNPLKYCEMPKPVPCSSELLIRIIRCGVCHTELDEIEGRTAPPNLPVILGHQVIGRVEEAGADTTQFRKGDRVGIGWIYSSCGHCSFCTTGKENLCKEFRATGRDVHGGYAEYMVVPERSAFAIPEMFSDSDAAPLLCAGAIGFRSLHLTHLQDGQRLGLTGFGASGHLILKMCRFLYPQSEIYVFARSEKERAFARELGASWAGNTTDSSPEKCGAIIDTTPVWKPVVEALQNLESDGRLVINAIRKEDTDKDYLLNLEYPVHLWMEKEIKSVANVAYQDIRDFLDLAAEIPIKPEVQEYSLEQANSALVELKQGKIRGAKVLCMD
jgi:propanol-preferring alcohol dehydrogenase